MNKYLRFLILLPFMLVEQMAGLILLPFAMADPDADWNICKKVFFPLLDNIKKLKDS